MPASIPRSVALTLVLAVVHCGARTELIVPPLPLVLALGGPHSCARMPDRSVRCWGDNTHGELGDGTTTPRTRPTAVLALSDVTQVAIGLNHACALVRSGGVMCWGGNASGMLGDGTMVDHAIPAPVVDLANVTRIAVGDDMSCAVLRDGTVRCWGNDSWRNPPTSDGHGGITFNRDDNDVCRGPTRLYTSDFPCRMRPRVIQGVDDAIDVAVGGNSACALRRDGTVRCWGQIVVVAPSTIEPSAVPMRGLNDVVQIAMTGVSGCALDAAGVVHCWGFLGGNQVDAEGAVSQRIDFLDGAVAIAVELGVVCALRWDQSVRCFAHRASEPDVTSELPELHGATSIAAGYSHLCATFGGDDVRCRGENREGELGIGTRERVAGAVGVRW